MDSGGPFTFGDFPDEFEPTEPEVSGPSQGWLPPEDRPWRHPSELRTGGSGRRPGDGHPKRTPPHRNLVGVGVLGAALAAAGVLYLTSSGAPPPATATDTSLVTVGPDVARVVEAVSPSLVSLQPANGSRQIATTGIVMPAGNLIVTAAAAVKTGEHMVVVSADGRRLRGDVEGVDVRSGVAVVSVARRLAPGAFVDEVVGIRQIAIAACRCDSDGWTEGGADASTVSSGSMPEVAMGMIQAVGMGPDDGGGGPALLDAIKAEVPPGRWAWGSVLLDDKGGVLGVLDAERTIGGDTYGYFVPAPLALAVAEELAQDHRVVRGWLGVLCQDDNGTGAEVTTVIPGSPAATAGLQSGDVVEAVDSDPVSSITDLQALLYVAPPGTRLAITLLRAGVVRTTPVTVGAGPS